MKKILVPTIAFLLGASVMAIISWKNNNDEKGKKQISNNLPNPDARPIIAIRKLKLKTGASADTLEDFAVKLAHNEYSKMPGVKEYIAKAERGDDMGSYIYVTEFDSKITRDFYYPIPGGDSSKTSPEALKFLHSGTPGPDLSHSIELVPSGKEGYTDYIVLE
jgi:hypothetical protein